MGDMDLMRAPVMVRYPGPMVFSFRTSMCKDCRDVRTLWRLSYKSFRDGAEYIQRDPDAYFHMLRQHGWKGDMEVWQYVNALCWAMRKDSSIVRVDVSRLESRNEIRKAFRLAEKYERCGRYVDRAIRLVRQLEKDGGVIDDYAIALDSAISELVNRRY